MHHLFHRASRLTLSLFSLRPWVRPRAASPGIRSACEPSTTGRAAVARRPASSASSDTTGLGLTDCSPGEIAAPICAHSPAPALPRVPRARTVRVLHRREGAAERLAIVGRMADVCAELDRLAAREQLC